MPFSLDSQTAIGVEQIVKTTSTVGVKQPWQTVCTVSGPEAIRGERYHALANVDTVQFAASDQTVQGDPSELIFAVPAGFAAAGTVQIDIFRVNGGVLVASHTVTVQPAAPAPIGRPRPHRGCSIRGAASDARAAPPATLPTTPSIQPLPPQKSVLWTVAVICVVISILFAGLCGVWYLHLTSLK